MSEATFPGFNLHPEVALVVLAAGCWYWWATRRLAPARRNQQVAFWSGLVSLLVCASWPLHDVGERYLFSAHMIQHWGFAYVAAPLILFGLPDDLVLRLMRYPVFGAVARVLTRPVAALVLFNVETLFLHWKPVVNEATESAPLHFLVHLALFSVALGFWFPVVKSIAGMPSLRSGPKLLYLAAQTFVTVIPVAALALAGQPIYEHYVEAPRLWGIDVLSDQQAAAGAMWLLSSFYLTGAMMIVFFRWFADEQRRSGWRPQPRTTPT